MWDALQEWNEIFPQFETSDSVMLIHSYKYCLRFFLQDTKYILPIHSGLYFPSLQVEVLLWICSANKPCAEKEMHPKGRADTQNCSGEGRQKKSNLHFKILVISISQITIFFLKILLLTAAVSTRFRDMGKEFLFLYSKNYRRSFCLHFSFGPHFSLNLTPLLYRVVDVYVSEWD